jgi:hypothetical protein
MAPRTRRSAKVSNLIPRAYGAADAAFGEGLELDTARFVVAAGGVDEADHAVLDEVAELDRVRHRRGDAAGERLDEGQTGGDAVAMTNGKWLTLHDSNDLQFSRGGVSRRTESTATAIPKLKRTNGES